MRLGPWIMAWLAVINKTRFDAEDLHELFLYKTHNDWNNGLTPLQSSFECLEQIEDFIERYHKDKEC